MSDACDNRPAVDRRDAEQIARQVRQALNRRMPALEPTQVSSALIAVFARYCEILIERINCAPHKALLVFVNLLGLSPHPPQPARVPLTFSMTPKCSEVVRIPKGTQVAGSSADEGAQPVVFETEEDLYVSPLALATIMIRDPQRDRYGDLSHVAGVVTSPVRLFDASQPTQHCLYIGQSTILSQPCHALHVRAEVLESQAPEHSAGSIQWELWNSKEWMPIVPERDETNHLTRSGCIVFPSVPGSVPRAVSQATNAWLRGRLLTPLLTDKRVEADDRGRSRTVRIKRLTLQAHRRVEKVEVTHAFVNQVPLDTSKELYLFGQKPQFGDVLYLAQTPALGAPGGRVTLFIELLNPQGGGSDSIPETYTSPDLVIQWEISGVKGWTVVGVSEAGRAVESDRTTFTDRTRAFAKSGEVSFVTPPDAGPQSVNGVEAVWLRVRILAGDYGKEDAYSPRDPKAPEKGYVMRPATLAPPIAKGLRISMEIESGEETPESIITCNDFAYRDVTPTVQEARTGFTPFLPMEGGAPVVHLGFSMPGDRVSLSGYPVNVYFHCGDGSSAVGHEDPTAAALDLLWEYWNGQGWDALPVVDRPHLFGQAGVLRFYAPSNWPVSDDFNSSLNWIRMRVGPETVPFQAQCRGIVPHTAMAIHATTLQDEVLGSTNGTPNQSFRTLRTPVLPGQQLEVCESFELNVPYRRRDGDKMWVEWKVVDHFLHSGPHDCHYTIDRQTGVITFGDGKRGVVPPPGINNVVLKEYRIGGGSIGNVSAASITQLRTTIPYIDQKVTNLVSACGGTDSETPEAFVPRALRLVRHRNRAVTSEDYEDLALAASPLVAQARCVPSYDLAKDPHGQRKQSGVLSLIVLPRDGSNTQPMPDRTLLQLVWSHLKTMAPPDIEVWVVPPRYVPVDVKVEVVLQSNAVPVVVEKNIQEEICRLLHPVSGGIDGRGWKLGEYPNRSEFHSRIMNVPGVHHVRRVSIPDDSSELVRSGFFHICSGVQQVQSMPRAVAEA